MIPYPKHAHRLTVEFDANAVESLAEALRDLAHDIETRTPRKHAGLRTGAYGWDYQYSHDPAMTPERYEAEYDEALGQVLRDEQP